MASRASTGGRTRVGKYELGRVLGEGTFAKVKFARNTETGENFAIKILDKEKILRHKMIDQVFKLLACPLCHFHCFFFLSLRCASSLFLYFEVIIGKNLGSCRCLQNLLIQQVAMMIRRIPTDETFKKITPIDDSKERGN